MSGRAQVQYERNPRTGDYTDSSFELGKCIGSNIEWILVGLLVFLVAWMLYNAFSSCESDNASIGSIVTHYSCRKTGGCGSKCPYMNMNDPRMALISHRNIVKEIADKLEEEYGNTVELTTVRVSQALPDQKDGLQAAVKAPLETLKLCLDKVFPLLTKVEDLVSAYSKQKSTTADVYNAQNRGAALEAAAIINLRIFSIANMKIGAILKDNRLSNLAAQDKMKVDQFDKEYAKAFAAKTSVDEYYLKALSFNSSSETATLKYDELVRAVLSADTSFETVVAVMARLISAGQDINNLEQTTAAHYKIISDLAKQVESFEGFSNSLPGSVTTDELSSFIANNDYNTALIKTALEPEIVSNHRKFANERMTFDSGGGVPSVLDHDTDINPWVGLFGRPTYRKTNGTSADVGSEPLRSIPSDNPDNLMRERTPRLTLV